MDLSEKDMTRFLSKINKNGSDGCWLWTCTLDKDGYGILKAEGRKRKAHRLSYEIHKGDIPAGLVIDHLCRVKNCVRPEHLEATTGVENIRRGSVVGGTWTRGEGSGTAKLTEKQVIQIYQDPRLLREIAADYGISFGHVSLIRLGKSWSWLTKDL